MNPTRLMSLTCTVTRVTATGPDDVFGDPTEVTTVRTFKGEIQQRTTLENTVGADIQDERLDLWLEPAAANLIDGNDRVTIDGRSYEVDGPAWPWRNPRTQVTTHVQCQLRRVT